MITFIDENQHSTSYWDAQEVSKVLGIRDPNTKKILGRNKFLQWCRFNGILLKDSNMPKQSYVTLNLMIYHLAKRRYRRFGMPLWSERGIEYMRKKVQAGEYQFGYEKIDKKTVVVKLEDIM